MKKLFLIIPLSLFYFMGYAQTTNLSAPQQEIQNLFNTATKCWNNGDLNCFMNVLYVKSDSTIYISGTTFIRGWQNSYQHYVTKYGNSKQNMGQLQLSFDEIRVLDDQHAFAYGKYHLKVFDKIYDGVTSVLLIKNKGQWKVLVDHSNS